MIKHLYDTFAERYYHGGSIFVYSDTHFSDLDCYKRRFPEKFGINEDDIFCLHLSNIDINNYQASIVKELDQLQIDNINKTVHKNDTLIILGDVGNIECVKKLKAGYKVLIMGNHDRGASNYKRIKETKEIIFKVDAQGNPIKSTYKEDNGLFDEVYEGNLYISGKIKLSHAPAPETGYINLHGHDHAKNDGYCFAAEHIDYTPVNLKTIFESGILGKTTSFRRATVDKAIERKAKREK